MRSLSVVLVTLLAAVACGGKSPTKPTVLACQQNNTAEMIFMNRSTSNTTYDIIMDGVRTTTVAPGRDSDAYTVSAGATHSVTFRVTNTTLAACNTAFPNLAQCARQELASSGL
jgi:hypothetical protein